MKVRLLHQGGGPIPPTMNEIRKDECEKMGQLIGFLSYKDPVLRRRLGRYLERLQKLQSETPVPAE